MSEELKPCPWCGKEPSTFVATAFCQVYCHNCGVSMEAQKPANYLSRLITCWNTRRPEPPRREASYATASNATEVFGTVAFRRCLEALSHYTQADPEGIMVTVSRQAVDELLTMLAPVYKDVNTPRREAEPCAKCEQFKEALWRCKTIKDLRLEMTKFPKPLERREAEQRVIDDALDALYSALPFVEDADPKYYHKGFPKRMEWRVRAAIGKIEALKKDAGYLTPPPSVEQVKPAPKDDELTIARAYAIVGKHSNFAGYHCVECGAFWYPTGYGKEWHEPGCAKAVPPAQECDDCFGVGKVPNTAMTEMRDCLKCKPAAPSDAKAQETVRCGCMRSDAWRCARTDGRMDRIACECECHRKPAAQPEEKK